MYNLAEGTECLQDSKPRKPWLTIILFNPCQDANCQLYPIDYVYLNISDGCICTDDGIIVVKTDCLSAFAAKMSISWLVAESFRALNIESGLSDVTLHREDLRSVMISLSIWVTRVRKLLLGVGCRSWLVT